MSIGQIVSECPVRTGIAKTKESNSWRWSKARILVKIYLSLLRKANHKTCLFFNRLQRLKGDLQM